MVEPLTAFALGLAVGVIIGVVISKSTRSEQNVRERIADEVRSGRQATKPTPS